MDRGRSIESLPINLNVAKNDIFCLVPPSAIVFSFCSQKKCNDETMSAYIETMANEKEGKHILFFAD